jgi:ferric-dicitrate binding protein FerR (iron transport regulator)
MTQQLHYIIEQLIPSILEGDATEGEYEIFQEWINEDDKHVLFFEEINSLWNSSGNKKINLNIQSAWSEFQKKTSTNTKEIEKPVFKIKWKAIGLAASLALIVSTGLFYYFQNQSAVELCFSPTTLDSVLLQDGSKITGLKNTKITYPSKFKGNTREVKQDNGTAFFEITKNPEKPFIIHSALANIKVLGTSFKTNVSADSVEVIVATGKVSVSNLDKEIILLPGEKTVFYKNKQQEMKVLNADSNFLFLKKGVLVYNNVLVEEVIKDVEQKFNCHINIANTTLSGKKINGRFKANKPDDILEAIAEIYSYQ